MAGWQQAESSSRYQGTWYQVPWYVPGTTSHALFQYLVPGTNEKVLRIPILINFLPCGLRLFLLNRHHLMIALHTYIYSRRYIFRYENTCRHGYTGMSSSYSSCLASLTCRLMSMNLIQLSFFCIKLSHLRNMHSNQQQQLRLS